LDGQFLPNLSQVLPTQPRLEASDFKGFALAEVAKGLSCQLLPESESSFTYLIALAF
jgi:hypothetical protein